MKPFVLDEPINGTFWPELEPNPHPIGDYGTGYYNVLMVDTDISMTGYRFDYIFFDKDGNSRYLSSISLPRLRLKVLNAGHKWKVLDVDAAMKILSINLLDLYFRDVERAKRLANNKFSGVAYVRKRVDENISNGYLWVYFKYNKDNQNKYHFSAKTLRVLKKKAQERKVPWIILHEETYKRICDQEELYL